MDLTIKENRKILLEEFLKKEGAYEKFEIELFNRDKDFSSFVNRNNAKDLLLSAFTWEETPNNHRYWSELNVKWQKFIGYELH